jgi:nucleoside-diphosphate-sugar epimerase
VAQKKQLLDLVYVDDAVDAIVAAMQYQTSHPITVDATSGMETSVASTAATIQSFLPHGSAKQRPQAANHNPSLREQHQSRSTQRRLVLAWAPKTSIREGIFQTIAWHLDRDAPYGPTVETGDAFLKRHDQKTCFPEDLRCVEGRD